jgi:hypothetical protein
MHASLMRRVFVTAMVQRRAGDHAEHPKFAAAASMGIRWCQASCHIMIHCQQIMFHVSFNDFREDIIIQFISLGPKRSTGTNRCIGRCGIFCHLVRFCNF